MPDARREFFDHMAPRWDQIHSAAEQAPAIEEGLAAVAPLDGAAVVDVGCGTGVLEPFVLPRLGAGRITAIDLAPRMIEIARAAQPDPRVSWLAAEATGAPIADGSVDVVLCYNALPHFPDWPAAIAVFRRWLRPGGRLLVWHDGGREAIAAIHAQVGPPIAEDRLPPVADLAACCRSLGLACPRAEESAAGYLLLAVAEGDAAR